MSRRRPSMTTQARRGHGLVKATAEEGRGHEKTRLHLYVWPADLARIDDMILGKGGWGSRRGVLARILSIGLPIMEAEVLARRRYTGTDPSYASDATVLHARFVAKDGAS